MYLLPFLARCIGHLLQRDHDCLYIRFGAKPPQLTHSRSHSGEVLRWMCEPLRGLLFRGRQTTWRKAVQVGE